MSGPSICHAYRYAFPSHLQLEAGRRRLELATSGGPEAHPWFCRGVLTAPRLTAGLLLGIAKVAQSRFHTPPNSLARILAAADPVVTSSRDRLRFEGFSACCGVYARMDAEPAALDADILCTGTTNVDFNGAMRSALAQVDDNDRVTLSVGADRVELERSGGAVVERKVALPLRWIKGFAEVQAYQARMKLAFETKGDEAFRFLRSIPRQATGSRPSWVERSGRGLRLSFRESGEGVPVVGTERLRVLEPIARGARALRIYSDGRASAWELVFDGVRFVLAISPEPSRGFSGEGQVLSDVVRAEARDASARVRAALRWESRIDPAALARKLSMDRADVAAAIATLGSRGLVGFDVAEGTYFHRELPFDLELVETIHPRLRAARTLVAEKAVTRVGDEAHVRSEDVVHRVRLSGGDAVCTCPWYAKYRGTRGPCKHVLAVQLTEERDDA